MITSAVKCCQFYGNEIEKPIPSYHIYEGDVFELIDQSVSFVMSRINATVSGRDKSILADVVPELPLQAVTEAIVNAICHRDYTSNASVQIMLFKNRLEIWNPGQLPYGLTVEMLKTKHSSRPANPLLARPMYLYGSIEQVGTGTEMIVKKCVEQGLRSPDFEQGINFVITFWRKEDENADTEEDNNENNTEKDLRKDLRKDLKKDLRKDIEKDLTQNQKRILKAIQKNAYITQLELSSIIKINEKNIRKNIEILKDKGFIKRIGPNKGGHWKIINEKIIQKQ
jgi:predicted HTH transcriptional regulator